jgi:hypothetical protein
MQKGSNKDDYKSKTYMQTGKATVKGLSQNKNIQSRNTRDLFN